jgi:ribulose-5-phosphate 4-epimerase/fuculose-1-phosphate aldolase
MLLEKLRAEVAATALTMFRWGLVKGTSGNVSARDSETGYVAITPSGRDYETMTPEDVVVVTLDGKVVEGLWMPSNEKPMHTVCYRERVDVNAVVHTHASYCVALSMVCDELPVAIPEIIFTLGGSVKVAPYVTPGTEELGKDAMKLIGDRKAIILQNHGTLTIGDNLSRALHASVSLEDAAYVYYLALQLGKPWILPPVEVRNLRMRAGYKD